MRTFASDLCAQIDRTLPAKVYVKKTVHLHAKVLPLALEVVRAVSKPFGADRVAFISEAILNHPRAIEHLNLPSEPFGVKLKRWRIRRGLTQLELAELSGVCGKAYIGSLENGRRKDPTLEIVIGLCRALDCTPNDLIDTEV